MTRDRAIRLARKWSLGGVCTLREGEAEEYHKICLEALMEQELREQKLRVPSKDEWMERFCTPKQLAGYKHKLEGKE